MDGLALCPDCGTRILIRAMEKPEGFFEDEYIRASNTSFLEEYRDVALSRIGRILRRHDTGWHSFLDIGSATGNLFKFYEFERLDQVVSVEPSNFGVARIKERYPFVKVIQARIDEVDFSFGSFDAAALFDSIYYHDQPYNLLGRIHRWLAPEGVLFCEVPNYSWLRLVAKVQAKNTYWRAYYDRAAILTVLERNGFKTIAVYNNVGHVPPGIQGTLHRTVYWAIFAMYQLSTGRIDFIPKITVVARRA